MSKISTTQQSPHHSRPVIAKIAGATMLAAAFALAAIASGKPPYLPLHVQVGEKAPDFTLPDANGKPIRLSSFSGNNVLLDFYEGYW